MDGWQSDAPFQRTNWTLLSALREGDEAARERANAVLCERYWAPVYAYLRREGRRPEAAAELAQAFFVEVVQTRGLWDRADQSRGRLRSLLLTALQNYCRSVRRRERSRDIAVRELAELRRSVADAPDASAARTVFEREWGRATVGEAVRRCEAHFVRAGRSGHWRLFETCYLLPAMGHASRPEMDRAATEAGFESAAGASAALQVVRTRFRALLAEVVAETVEDPSDVADERALLELAVRSAG